MDQIKTIDSQIATLNGLYNKMSEPNVSLQTHMGLHEEYIRLEKEVRENVNSFQEKFQELTQSIEQQWSVDY